MLTRPFSLSDSGVSAGLVVISLVTLTACSTGGSPAQPNRQKDVAAYLERADTFQQEGRGYMAALEYGKVLGIDPTNHTAHFKVGGILLDHNNLKGAEIEYSAALSTQDDFETRYALGDVALRQGRFDEAVAQFERAVALRPDGFWAHTQLGIASVKAGSNENALASFKTAYDLKTQDAVARHNLGFAHRLNQQYDPAIQLLAQLVKDYPERTISWFELGVAYEESGNTDAAEAAFARVVELKPDHTLAQERLQSLRGG